MHKYFIAIHFFVRENRLLSIGIAAVFLLVCGFFASRLSFEEDITRLIPRSERSDETSRVLSQLKFTDKITVIVHAKNGSTPEQLTEVAAILLDSLAGADKYIQSVQGRLDDENIQETFDFVYQNLPLFLDEHDYSLIASKLQKDSVKQAVENNYKALISPTGIVTRDFILKDPLGISFIALRKLQQLNLGDDFDLYNGFIFTKDKSKLLLFINPRLAGNETRENTIFVDQLNNIKSSLNKEFKEQASVDFFGSSLIAVANAKQIKSDIMTTTLVAISALMFILILYYRKLFIPVIIFIPTIFGVLFAVGMLYFLRGTISAISLSIGAILLGVTIDYSLHILTHYKQNSDIETLYKDITKPLIMSSTTTAVAFLCLLFVKSEALKDLGIFAAISVVVTSFFSLLLIPHLYKPNPEDFKKRKTILDRLANFSFDNNRWLLWGSLIIIAISLFTFTHVGFNEDISQLNFIPEELQEIEKDLEASTNLTSKSLYLASYGDSMDEALENNYQLSAGLEQEQKAGKILNYSTVGGIVLSAAQQQQKIKTWNSFWDETRKQALISGLIGNGNNFGFKPDAYQPFFGTLGKSFNPISYKEYLKLSPLSLGDLVSEKNGFFTVLSIIKVDNHKRDAVVSALSARKNLVIIDRQQINETFLGQLKDDFNSLINYSFVAVVLILFFFFRKIELVIISCIPIVITGIVTTGIMGVFDIQFNIFSTIVCTLVFGHGVDFSIFMTSALQKEYSYGKSEMATYRTSILLAVLTTVLGIGALIFAGHPALKSISSVSLIGVFAALIITFIFYPILFRFFLSHRVKKGKSPLEFWSFFTSSVSFLYYGLGGIMFSVLSLIAIYLFPAKKGSQHYLFRFLMSKFMRSVMVTNLSVKTKVLNPNKEDFKKPVIIIANHTSFLDILVIGMLNPKIIFLVSDWVYNSPIFGKGVRFAGFYPVSQGIEGGVEHLREKVNQGYSLMVFPEGTRSYDNHIKRFHKGAFFLSEHFNIDILPILIHGNSEALPKGDFIINDDLITLKFLDRISPSDHSFGETYPERTKKIAAFYKASFKKMRDELEGPGYFRKMILLSFAYKEREIIREVRASLDKNLGIYHQVNKLIPPTARIVRIADDHGEFDLLLTLQEPQRKVSTWIMDEEKREVAKTNYIRKKREIHYPGSEEELMASENSVLLISGKTEYDYSGELSGRFRQVIHVLEDGNISILK